MAKYLDGEGLKLVVRDYDGKIGKKVDAVSGKQLSTNDYDNTAKGIVDSVSGNLDKKVDKETGKQLIETTKVTKLDGIEEGAQVNEITEANLESKVTGKGFAKSSEIPTDYLTEASLNDYAKTSEIPDVSGLQEKASLGSDVEGLGFAKTSAIPDVTGKQDKATLDSDVEGLGYLKEDALTGYAKSTDIPDISGKMDTTTANSTFATQASVAELISSGVIYKGSVETKSALDALKGSAQNGHMYNVTETDMNYVFNGTDWDAYAPMTDISGKADKTELPEALSTQEIQNIISGTDA